MTIVIVEDELETALNLERLIKKLRPEANVIKRLSSVEKALHYFGNEKLPDLIFMDVELSDGSCFEIFDEIKLPTPIIFTTAYDKFLAKSFEVNNLNYLLKPVSQDALEGSIQKFERLYVRGLQLKSEGMNQSMLNGLLAQSRFKTRFLVRYENKMVVIRAKDIDYISKDGLVFLWSKGKKYVMDYSLDDLEHKLDELQFFRINRQVIVNILIIISIENYFGGRLLIKHTGDPSKELIVSQRRSSDFQKWLNADSPNPSSKV